MKRYGSIYKITNKLSGKIYVGQTVNKVEDRFYEHRTEKRNNRHISSSLKKHGVDNFLMEEIYIAFCKEKLNSAEVLFVSKFNCLSPNGYNHRAGGDQNGICSEELKQKISNAKMGKPNFKKRGEARSTDYRMKISKGLGGKTIKATNKYDGRVIFYSTAHETRLDGHNPSNVVQICKKTSYRTHSKGWIFEYDNHANQNGSAANKIAEHVQRLEIEPAKMQNRISPRVTDNENIVE